MEVSVQKSHIHGFGLFAAEPIQEGETIICLEGEPTQDLNQFTCFVVDCGGVLEVIDCSNEMRFVNTSPNSNADFEGVCIVSTRDITEGEEIVVERYKTLKN